MRRSTKARYRGLWSKAKLGVEAVLRRLHREHETLAGAVIEDALGLADVPFLENATDGDRARGQDLAGHAEVVEHASDDAGLAEAAVRLGGDGVQADDQAGEVIEQRAALRQQHAVGDQQHAAEAGLPASHADQLLDIGTDQRLAAGEQNGIHAAANGVEHADGGRRVELFAEDLRVLLGAVAAIEVALVGGVEDRRVGADDVGAANAAAVKVGGVGVEILEDEGVFANHAPEQIARGGRHESAAA